MAGFEEALAEGLSKSIGSKIGTVKAGTQTPADLYSEAAPRIVKALEQYDKASPLIDFATKYWYIVVVGAFVVGVGSGVAANYLYDKLRGRRT